MWLGVGLRWVSSSRARNSFSSSVLSGSQGWSSASPKGTANCEVSLTAELYHVGNPVCPGARKRTSALISISSPSPRSSAISCVTEAGNTTT